MGPRTDNQGRCPTHPFVQLQRLSPRTNEWKALLDSCPICAMDTASSRSSSVCSSRASSVCSREGERASSVCSSREEAGGDIIISSEVQQYVNVREGSMQRQRIRDPSPARGNRGRTRGGGDDTTTPPQPPSRSRSQSHSDGNGGGRGRSMLTTGNNGRRNSEFTIRSGGRRSRSSSRVRFRPPTDLTDDNLSNLSAVDNGQHNNPTTGFKRQSSTSSLPALCGRTGGSGSGGSSVTTAGSENNQWSIQSAQPILYKDPKYKVCPTQMQKQLDARYVRSSICYIILNMPTYYIPPVLYPHFVN